MGFVQRHMLGHNRFIARVAATQYLHGSFFSRVASCLKADLSFMKDKCVSRQQVLPAQCGCSQAEVIFFAITFSESFNVEQTHFVQAVTTDVHAKSDGCRDFNMPATVGGCKSRIKALCGFCLGQYFHACQRRVIAKRGIAGERRDSPDSCCTVRMHEQSVQPVVGNFRVAVK